MLVEWATATGGVQGTLDEIRNRTRSDQRSALSRIIHRVWSKQAQGGKSDWMSVAEQLDASIGEIVRDPPLPDECISVTWLQPLLIETPGVFS